MIFKDVKSVTEHIYALPNLHPKNDLSYIKRVLECLGDPQNLVKMIHVTGTNGKGSTSYYLSNLLKKAGQKTGLFVSPYIRSFNERIQLNGEYIPDRDLVIVANEVEQVIRNIQKQEPNFSLVTFEYEVAMAFVYFAKEKCDYAVIEVGIGAEHDKTNVIVPEVSIITTIAMDHEQIIGPTISDIAREKSGVIKQDVPLVIGKIPQEIMPIIKEKAKEENAPIFQLGKDFQIQNLEQLEYYFKDEHFSFHKRPLVEEYDIAIAVNAFGLLKLPIEKKEIESAINATSIPGRYQIIEKNPDIIFDGAHNIQAMNNLLDFVKNNYGSKKIKVLITMMKDKDIEEVFSLFDDQFEVFLTTIPYPRAAKKENFPRKIQDKYPYLPDFKSAYRNLKANLDKDDVLVVTGSFYLVSGILNTEEL